MPFRQIIKISLLALRTNKTRSALTMLGVIIGVASVILLVALGNGLQNYITDQLEGIGSNLIIVMPGKMDMNTIGSGSGAAGFLNPKLELRDAKAIETETTTVTAAVAGTVSQSAIKYDDEKFYAQIVGMTANFHQALNSPLKSGDYYSESDDNQARKVVVLGSDMAKELFKDADPIGEKVIIADNKFTVIGVLEHRGVGSASNEDHAAIPLTTALRLFNQEKISTIYVQVASSDKMDLAQEEVKQVLLDRLDEDDFTLVTQQELLGAISSILGVLTSALAGIAAISLVVGGIGIMNIMLVSVTERIKEIGLRKALGATPNVILVQFLIEAVVLSVGGGLVGILIGALGALGARQAIPAEVTPDAVLLAFGVSAMVGIIFGVMPARRAAKLNPIEALRYE